MKCGIYKQKADPTYSLEKARSNIWLVDSKGLVTKTAKDLAHHKLPYAHDIDTVPGNLLDAVKLIKPTAIIGVSAQGQTFTKEICEEMNSIHFIYI